MTAMTTIMAAAGLASAASPRPLEGRVALVTGSTSGIGLGIAGDLAARGTTIVLNGFGDVEKVQATCRNLSSVHDVPVLYDGADMSDPTAISDMIERIGRSAGAVDILVNNAGIQHVASIEEFPAEKWEAILAVNLSAAFHTI